MNENEMTDEQMEEATNPFAGMAVDGDESVKGVTEEEQQEMQDAVDTNNDGVVSEEELDSAVDKLAEMENDNDETGILPHNDDESDDSTDSTPDSDSDPPEVSSDPITDTTEEEPVTEAEESDLDETQTIEYPTKKSLSVLFPPSHDEANMSHQQDWARACVKFSEENDCHFLGLSVKNGEPMFKEKK